MLETDPLFANRTDAGRRLGAELARRALPEPRLVLALPRGGVPVAAEVARALDAPLGLMLVRKLPAPGDPELAVGALAEGDPPEVVMNPGLAALTGAGERYLQQAIETQQAELVRRRKAYLGEAAPPEVKGRTVVVVDDGLATGASAKAAGLSLRRRNPDRLVLAVPVGPAETVAALRQVYDEVVCPHIPPRFLGVGSFYREFHQLDDEEVVALLRRASETTASARPVPGRAPPQGS